MVKKDILRAGPASCGRFSSTNVVWQSEAIQASDQGAPMSDKSPRSGAA